MSACGDYYWVFRNDWRDLKFIWGNNRLPRPTFCWMRFYWWKIINFLFERTSIKFDWISLIIGTCENMVPVVMITRRNGNWNSNIFCGWNRRKKHYEFLIYHKIFCWMKIFYFAWMLQRYLSWLYILSWMEERFSIVHFILNPRNWFLCCLLFDVEDFNFSLMGSIV